MRKNPRLPEATSPKAYPPTALRALLVRNDRGTNASLTPHVAVTRTQLVHFILGVALIAILPSLSFWRGEGALAFTMFSRSGSYRLRMVTTDARGNEHRVPPTAVAARTGGSIGDLLAGSEDWRFAPSGPLLRRRIEQIATLTCLARPGSARARVVIEERRTLDAPVRVSEATVACP